MLGGSSSTTVLAISRVASPPCKSQETKQDRSDCNSCRYLVCSWFIGHAEVERNYHSGVHSTQSVREGEVEHDVFVTGRAVWCDLTPQGWY